MKDFQKMMMINTIINFVGGGVKKHNRGLVSENLHSEQRAFDVADLFFTLAFMSDKNIKSIFNKII